MKPMIRVVCCRCATLGPRPPFIDVEPRAIATADDYAELLEQAGGWKALVKMDNGKMLLRPVCAACYTTVCEAGG